jgi:hypothetical protein
MNTPGKSHLCPGILVAQVNGVLGNVHRMYEQLRKEGVLELVAARTVSLCGCFFCWCFLGNKNAEKEEMCKKKVFQLKFSASIQSIDKG